VILVVDGGKVHSSEPMVHVDGVWFRAGNWKLIDVLEGWRSGGKTSGLWIDRRLGRQLYICPNTCTLY
jgi:hypothetical protein